MNMPVKEGFGSLSEKEKQTLRLIVRGHDAKSAARDLGLSVHTIHERLREARRKMAVSSSREAARLLLEAESDAPNSDPQFLTHTQMGEDADIPPMDQESAPSSGVGRAIRRPRILIGVLLMTFTFTLLALAALPQMASTPAATPVAARTVNAEVVDSARQWLVLLDQGRWDESYRATGAAFRKLNTGEIWASTSEQVRTPLGAVVSRTFISQQNLPAPPNGYEVVKFKTRFANKADAVETVTLNREDGGWHVVGVTIE